MMLKSYEDELICDLAETYHILDYRKQPPLMVATFAIGLRNNSRVALAMSGQKLDMNETLLAGIVDRLNWLVWSKTKDGQENRNRPESVLDTLSGNSKEKSSDILSFRSGEDFENYRQKLIGGG